MPFALRNILLRSAAGLVLTAAGTSVAVAGAATTPTARSGPANHGNPTVYLDLPPGDGGGAPDIFLTTVGNTAGGVLRFSFIVGNDEVFDDSPNGTEVWRYAVRTPYINGVQARFAPRAARAGSRFRLAELSVRLDSAEDVQPSSLSCSATLGRKRLRGGGAGGCSFALSRTARRKLLKIVITVAFADQTKTVTAYSARVR